ncbi:cell division protein ZapE [Galactobacter caseinivorans]|uniref:Cell division protein ZapE n=1 Tax=Galactobacter caseinivorans TaxID=2676123 RepID=A0A496PKT8_9MICC|nr:cell division protein ZapE [Galactobacter caseinivorans]RKW71015.1 cell division protein ZapE [Galactobacter caseinivorans]
MAQIQHLTDITPQVSADQLLAEMHPSYRFGEVSFDTYIPDPNQPSQAAAVERLRRFAGSVGQGTGGGFLGKLFGKSKSKEPAGLYLDGGFGVGKTHLLASLWHASSGKRAFGTFVEYTNLVGALSFRKAVDVLKGYDLVCIDEFELDDPGDTVLMSRLMRELADAGVKLAATSNTLPGSLGEGRFASQDFKREIQVLADQFESMRIDGVDFRHRGLPDAPAPLPDSEVDAVAQERYPDATIAIDDFAALMDHLSKVHPSRYRQMLKGTDVLALHNVETVTNQATALRFVVLADRLYDKDVPILASGLPFDQLFTEEMMTGGYLKKYHRAVSRLTSLVREGQGVAER